MLLDEFLERVSVPVELKKTETMFVLPRILSVVPETVATAETSFQCVKTIYVL